MKVLFEGKNMEIDDLSEGFYLVKLKTHRLYTGPRMSKEKIMNFINERDWNGLEVEIETANFVFDYKIKNKVQRDK